MLTIMGGVLVLKARESHKVPGFMATAVMLEMLVVTSHWNGPTFQQEVTMYLFLSI